MSERVPERSLASRLRLAVVRLNRRLRAQRTDEDVSLTQLSALSTLHKCGALTPGQLAGKEGVRPPSMTRVISALEGLGYVERNAHPTDGRQAIVALSARGLEHVHATISAREAWLDEQLTKLSDEERAVLAEAAEIIDRMAEQ
ncbi:MarR family winged helix-turn-helix transcriptional regulator [Amycolatopsis cihanbeyliensis]|uniref:DNA-binding MarR family transcriptional regulator n=1 Tax=Amycolatopsis cihanbeyliensis TaxID=1128664 RepID=A0A542DIF9_AMYCI|nr:MarR family transcriptional regulator [Amycolatopsis cihanbeyliensis]TQJ02887.1 DNA-binding MarR family transcriptional regulator [Amycolatopsis cihanbeyliensis]